MILQDSSLIFLICIWSMSAVGLGLLSGFFMGKGYTLALDTKRLKFDRCATLSSSKTATKLFNRRQKEHYIENCHFNGAQQNLESSNGENHFDEISKELATSIARVVESNRKLQNDLIASRNQLENQAKELVQTRREARTDSLCGVGNRKAVDETLQFKVSQFEQNQNLTSSFGLMLIDIDHFKRVNDTFGHQAGDEVLASISLALKKCVRPEDFVGRLGGDEFCILLEGLTDSNASLVGARIRSTIERYNFTVKELGQSTEVTMSMGLAVVRPEDDAVALYERADKALYRSKQLGRNRLFTISGKANEKLDRRDQQHVPHEDFKIQVNQQGAKQ